MGARTSSARRRGRDARAHSAFKRGISFYMNARLLFHRAHGVVVSHPLRMRKALGSNPSVSILCERAWPRLLCFSTCETTAQFCCEKMTIPSTRGFAARRYFSAARGRTYKRRPCIFRNEAREQVSFGRYQAKLEWPTAKSFRQLPA